MLIYTLEDLQSVYKTLEWLKNTYNITVEGIRGAKDVSSVKTQINVVLDDLLDKETNEDKIKELKKYKLK